MLERQASVSWVAVMERARMRPDASVRVNDVRSSEPWPRTASAVPRVRANSRRESCCMINLIQDWIEREENAKYNSQMSPRFLFVFTSLTVFAADTAQEGVRWWSHIQVLADDKMEGRETGSEGHRKAAQYVGS